ncbi:TPA: hypothetical protein RQK06_004486 [Vibrio vulnificus]|nr:hypothetical protein [Vibrio vulnificus]
MKVKDLYMRYFYAIIVLFCVVSYLVFLHANDGDALKALKEMAKNLGSGLLGAVLSLIVIRTQLEKYFDSVNLKNSGIKGYRNGYPEILESLGGVNKYFTLRFNKTIDIFGIAMSGFFEENDMVNLVCDRANQGYKVRVFFADPDSEELKNQELIEGKEGELKLNINRLTRELLKRMLENERCKNNIEVYHLKTLPRSFILRSGNRMIVTNYLYEGPTHAPSIYLKDDEYLNAFEKYQDYIESSKKPENSKRIQ